MTYSAADRERALALVIKDHLSLKDAEKQSGIGRARIRRWLKELGICLVPRFGGTVEHYLEVRQQAMKLLGQGVSVAEVARSCSVSVSVVRLWCKDSGMTIAQFRAQAAADQREKELALLVDELPQQTECAKVGRGRRLSNLQRRIIELADANGYNLASIASLADTSASTVSRGLKRGACDYAAYSALRGHEHAQHCAKRPRPRKLHVNQRLRHEVVSRLNLGQSPRLISKILSRDFSNDEQMSISHETIYQALYVQGKSGLRHELTIEKALHTGRTRRKPRSKIAVAPEGKTWVEGALITARPAEAQDRAVPGHWEGDLIIGEGHKSAIATLVERSSRFLMMKRFPLDHASPTVIAALSEMIGQLPEHLRRSLTWDKGSEMAKAAEFTVATNCPVYFCDPHSPWQRGTNENTNGLVRRFLPKGTDFRTISDERVQEIQDILNTRPRETLGLKTPAEVFNEFMELAITN